MFEITLLIPLTDNDNKRFNRKHHSLFESFVVERFGGLTLYGEGITGSWLDGGRLYTDTSRHYGIGIRSITEGALVGEVIDFAKAHYEQEAIFIRYLGVVEIL